MRCGTYEERRVAKMDLVGKAEGRVHLEDAGGGGRIILKWILKK